MKKSILLLILFICCTPLAWSATSLNQTLAIKVPSYVNISTLSSTTTGTINAFDGTNSGVFSTFYIQTNNTHDYQFILKSEVNTTEGITNAFANLNSQPVIIFGNNSPSKYPTSTAVNNIKANPTTNSNNNAIAYNISSVLTNINYTFKTTATQGGYHYQLYPHRHQEGSFRLYVGTNPIANTYLIGSDEQGIYEVTLSLTAVNL